MARYSITVVNVSGFTVEAESEDEAREEAEDLLARGDADAMAEIQDGSDGWVVTDAYESI